jgi:hypothetical protein
LNQVLCQALHNIPTEKENTIPYPSGGSQRGAETAIFWKSWATVRLPHPRRVTIIFTRMDARRIAAEDQRILRSE